MKSYWASYWADYNSLQFELKALCSDEGDNRVSFEDMMFGLTVVLRRKISNINNTLLDKHATIATHGIAASQSGCVGSVK